MLLISPKFVHSSFNQIPLKNYFSVIILKTPCLQVGFRENQDCNEHYWVHIIGVLTDTSGI